MSFNVPTGTLKNPYSLIIQKLSISFIRYRLSITFFWVSSNVEEIVLYDSLHEPLLVLKTSSKMNVIQIGSRRSLDKSIRRM